MNTNRANQMKTLTSALIVAAMLSVSACGGGGSTTPEPVSTLPAPLPVVVVPVAPTAPLPVLPIAVATLPAGASPSTSLADCTNVQSLTLPTPTFTDQDSKAASEILALVDPTQGAAELARVPASFMWWLRSAGATVNMTSISVAIHESNHQIDRLLSKVCSTDGLARFFVDGKVYTTGLKSGTTENYSLVQEAYPTALKTTRAGRFDVYITGSAAASGNGFSILLDELTAYTAGAKFEVNLLATPALKYAATAGDQNLGGMVDFMLYLQTYLQASRLNHPATYLTIQGQAQTLAFMQFVWTRAENILAAAYPFSNTGGGNQVVPLDVVAQIYSPGFLSELDRLGIAHKTAADWSTTYLR